jgi:hypothetical protein
MDVYRSRERVHPAAFWLLVAVLAVAAAWIGFRTASVRTPTVPILPIHAVGNGARAAFVHEQTGRVMADLASARG